MKLLVNDTFCKLALFRQAIKCYILHPDEKSYKNLDHPALCYLTCLNLKGRKPSCFKLVKCEWNINAWIKKYKSSCMYRI